VKEAFQLLEVASKMVGLVVNKTKPSAQWQPTYKPAANLVLFKQEGRILKELTVLSILARW
jgi:hypothetical protein